MTKFNIILSNEEVEQKLKELQDWIKNNPKMPRNLGEYRNNEKSFFFL